MLGLTEPHYAFTGMTMFGLTKQHYACALMTILGAIAFLVSSIQAQADKARSKRRSGVH
jgi:hypothetical protein